MSIIPSVPTFEMDQADRMRKALRHSGLTARELANRMQISEGTISRWLNGHNAPRRRDLMAFAMATAYPVRWLETGEAPPQDDPGTGLRWLPGLDSNQEPAVSFITGLPADNEQHAA